MLGSSERPQTRRGLSEQNPSGWGDHLIESGTESSALNQPSPDPSRPLTRMASEYATPKTGNISARMANSMRPPTSGFVMDSIGSRIVSGVNRPGSRLGTAVTNPRIPTTMPYMAAAERPTTQQGLGGLKTAARGLPQRQIQDKSYYLGLLRAKMTELGNEMLKLNKGIERNNKEVQSLPLLEKKVKEMAMEITELQGQAADLNVLQEKIATSSDVSQMESELQSILTQNEREAHQVEQILDDVKCAKERLALIEREIQIEEENAEKFINTLSPEGQERYNALKNEQDRLAHEVENYSSQLDELESRSRKLEEELRPFPLKEEMFRIRQAQAELEMKYQLMKEQDAKRLSPEDERAQLLAKVKNDNAEVAAMEQQINELGAHIERLQTELREVDHSYEESQSERGQKYRDLRKREEVMDEFLSTFESNYNEEKSRLDMFESQIASALSKVSKQLSLIQLVPSIKDYNNTKEDLMFKEGELEKSRMTLEGVAIEYQRMQTSLQKMEDLESRINEELTTLKEQLSNIDSNLSKFSNVEDLRQQADEKRNKLIMEQADLADKKTELQSQMKKLQEECNQLEAELDKNETHATLRTLDEKLKLVEEENESMRSFIEENTNKHNVAHKREVTMSVIQDYLKSLQLHVP